MKIEIDAPEISGHEFVRFGKARDGEFFFANDEIELWDYGPDSANLYLIYRKVEEPEPEYRVCDLKEIVTRSYESMAKTQPKPKERE